MGSTISMASPHPTWKWRHFAFAGLRGAQLGKQLQEQNAECVYSARRCHDVIRIVTAELASMQERCK